MRLEGEHGKADVAEGEVLTQEVQELKQLWGRGDEITDRLNQEMRIMLLGYIFVMLHI